MSFLVFLGLLVAAAGIFYYEPGVITGLFSLGLFAASSREFLRRRYHAPSSAVRRLPSQSPGRSRTET